MRTRRPRLAPDADPSLGRRDDVLIVTDRRFWDRSRGSEQRIANLAAHLASSGVRTSIAYVGRPKRSDRAALAGFRDAAHDLEIWTRSPTIGDPRSLVPGTRNSARRRFVQALLRRRGPRIVIVEFLRLSPAVLPRAGAGARPTFWLDTHDVLHQRAERYRRAGARVAREMTIDEERSRLDAFDAILAIQDRDAEIFRHLLPGRRVIEVPHGLELPPLPTNRPEDGRPRRLGFLAGRDPSNHDALDWFLTGVWPALRAHADPQAELHVAGRIGRDRHAPHHGVFAHGPIESIDRFWPDMDIAINPVRFGSGLKIKNVEALAYGRPLVTTPIGAEGLERASPRGLCIADGREAWREVLQTWLSDRTAAEKVGLAGRAHAEAHHGPDTAFRALDLAIASRLGGDR